MTPTEIEQELQALRQEIAALKQRPRARAARGRAFAIVLLGACVLASASVVLAAGGGCPNGLPFCFGAGTPAKATEINQNFAQLKEWVEAKVGAVAAGGASTAAVSMGTATVGNQTITGKLTLSGEQQIVGANAAGNLHIDASKPGGANKIYLNWFSGQGVVIGNGSATGVVMSTDASTVSVTNAMIVEGRRVPSRVVRNDCSGQNNCAANCPSGYTIKMAFGRHGGGSATSSGDWVCGGAFQWLGTCIDQASCTAMTQCGGQGGSGIFIECW